MVSEIDIWRAARLMMARHGANAATEAAVRADALLAAGDLDGQATWKRIVWAIEQLLSDKTGSGAAVH